MIQPSTPDPKNAIIRCLAIDDEPLALQQLAAYIGRVNFLELVATCSSAQEARAVLDEQNIDAIFIDINMPDLNGLDFVKSLAAPPITVFTTAYSEYALDGYKVNAVDYLLKPFGLEDFRRAAGKVRRQYELLHQQPTYAISQPDEDEALFLKTEHKIVRVNIPEITHIEGMSEYVKIYTEDRKPLTVLLSMKKLEDRLPKYFMRIHRSYIINLKKIEEVNKSRVIINAETYLPIGDLYRDNFFNYLNSKFLTK